MFLLLTQHLLNLQQFIVHQIIVDVIILLYIDHLFLLSHAACGLIKTHGLSSIWLHKLLSTCSISTIKRSRMARV